jgi:demethylmenaquinone methyltransferase/2-methoxy-6-polyprenyl-1,4-benzoquinol methylase
VLGSDFAHPMLCLARKKHSGTGPQHYVEADAMNLPFPDGSFDLVTAAFGFRNLVNYEAGLREIHRVLKRGGELGILEFSEPRPAPIRLLYRFYFKHILPRIGGAISGSNVAYSYLPASVSKFPSPEELAEMMRKCGFAKARFLLWTAGIVALHTGRRE